MAKGKSRMDAKRMARVMKALSHPNRLELYLEILKKCEAHFAHECGECMVSDIMDTFKIGAPTISHHLKELANADLITTERKGKFLVARVNEATIDEVNRILSPGRAK
jgi:ArsR family transcriptional regulator